MLNEYILQEIYDIICSDPGLDTPELCLELHKEDIVDPEYRGNSLASWLSEWHDSFWIKTCDHVDKLIETGHIIFSESGNLYPSGYQGDLS